MVWNITESLPRRYVGDAEEIDIRFFQDEASRFVEVWEQSFGALPGRRPLAECQRRLNAPEN